MCLKRKFIILIPISCGKTTMLSCIVGVRRLDVGEIFVFGNKPGERGSGVPGKNVGYFFNCIFN